MRKIFVNSFVLPGLAVLTAYYLIRPSVTPARDWGMTAMLIVLALAVSKLNEQ